MRIATGMSLPPTITGLYMVDSLVAQTGRCWRAACAHLAMPAVTLAFASLAWITRVTRTSMLETLRQDYVRTARGKGLAERSVVFQHALRNALIPTVTLVGLQTGALLAGAFLVEIIFSWPGIGFYTVNAIMAMDFNAIMSTTLLVAVVYTVTNLVVDIIYVALDPRIKLPVKLIDAVPSAGRPSLFSLLRRRDALLILTFLGESLAPYDPLGVDLRQKLKAPSLAHPFGTDDMGRDVLSRVMAGTRLSGSTIVVIMVFQCRPSACWWARSPATSAATRRGLDAGDRDLPGLSRG